MLAADTMPLTGMEPQTKQMPQLSTSQPTNSPQTWQMLKALTIVGTAQGYLCHVSTQTLALCMVMKDCEIARVENKTGKSATLHSLLNSKQETRRDGIMHSDSLCVNMKLFITGTVEMRTGPSTT